jgi:DNA processing protein
MTSINQHNTLLCQLALGLAPGIGPRTAAALLQHFGTAQAVMEASVKELMEVVGMGATRAQALKDPEVMARAEDELAFASRHGIRCLFLTDEAYPRRLRHCNDAPLLLYYKGKAALNAQKVIAVVGTRKHTAYGALLCRTLIEGLSAYPDVVVVSGLAYGIDAEVHHACVENNVPTIGVLAHGLDHIYPQAHRKLARDMLTAGGLLTEFPSGTGPDRTNFPVRNRIVAGMSDVTIVVESGIKGGAIITAYLASGYNREVAAFPGRATDEASNGCNMLIRTNIAGLITSATDLAALMGWDPPPVMPAQGLPKTLNKEQLQVVRYLRNKDRAHADELLRETGLEQAALATCLLQLELQDIVRALPGKYYALLRMPEINQSEK